MSPAGPSIRVVVADDSPFVCRLLTSYLESSRGVKVVGTANDGARAVELVLGLRPDVVTLDVEMPVKNGLEALEQIMRDRPTPALMLSGVSRSAAEVTMRALEIGAVDFVLKYEPGVDTNAEALRREIVAKVRAAARTKVVGLSPRGQAPRLVPSAPEPRHGADWPERVVVVGASTGGPLALRELLGELPADFDAAIVVAQHMPATFTGVLAAQLNCLVEMEVKEAEHGERLRGRRVLVAPGGRHLLISADARIELNQGPKVGGHRPSIDVTMQSAAQVFGRRTVGVLLTGMGADGAEGMASIRARSGRTFAQDAASCVVNGMPQRAVERGVVDEQAPPARIAHLLLKLAPRRPQPNGAPAP